MTNLCNAAAVWLVASVALVGCGSADSSAFDDKGGGGADSSVTEDTSGGGSDTTTPTDTVTPADVTPPPKDTAGGTDTTPPPIDTSPPPVVTLDSVCGRLADTICAAPLTSCCTKRGMKFDVATCRDNVLTSCGDAVDEVKAGDRTFDPSQFDACAAAWTKLTTTCSVGILDYIRTYTPCELLLNPKSPPGTPCTADSECHASAGAYANCNKSSGDCETISFVGKGAPCSYSGPDERLCNDGLFCPFATGGGGGTTVCDNAHPIGGGCGGGPFGSTNDPSCGFGNRCNAGKCAPGLPLDAACTSELQCASWNCVSGRCTDPFVQMANTGTCGG